MPAQAFTLRIEGLLQCLREATLAKLDEVSAAPASRHLLETGGKLLRPRVLFLCAAHCEAIGGHPDWDVCLDAALALELIHAGTLYHDDIVDRSLTRRGLPASHRLEGDRAAALAGSELIALGNQVAASLPDRLASAWGVAAVRMADGQLRDTEQSGGFDRTTAQFLRNARRKTASGFELAARFGTELGGGRTPEHAHLVDFGRRLGIAFQLADDLADFQTRPGNDRQPLNDLRERIYTLPAIIACALDGEEGAVFRELLEDDGLPLSESRARDIGSRLLASGALAATARVLEEEFRAAAALLGRLEPTPAVRALHQLLDAHCSPYRFVDATSVHPGPRS